MNKEITRSHIKNIGKKLRASQGDIEIDDNDLKILNNWRELHEPTLKYYGKLLRQQAKGLTFEGNSEFTVTQRLKRIHSIILKLKRFPDMQLSTMDDLAGARIVLPQIREVFDLAEILKYKSSKGSKHAIVKVNNYIAHPKDDGYRSIHIVYQTKKVPSIKIEVQLRSKLQHYWATGVEVFGTLEQTSFKTGEGNQEWKDFFALLSSYLAYKEGTSLLKKHEIYSLSQLRDKLISTIKELNIIELLNAYTSIYSSDWRNNRSRGKSGKYALLTLDSNVNKTDVEFFAEAKLKDALEKYVAIEKIHHSSKLVNVVLVNLDDIDKVEEAYPNYFMDTKVILNILSEIVLGIF